MDLTDFEATASRLQTVLKSRGWSVATAESLTVGNVQALIGSVPGSSEYFQGGVCAYNLEQKVALLGVDRGHAASCDCVSARVALEMAEGARQRFKADVGISTTGYAGEQGGLPARAHFAVAYPGGSEASFVTLPGLARVEVQRRVALAAVQWTLALL